MAKDVQGWSSGTFANVRLSEEEMNDYDAWVKKQAPDTTEALHFLLADGYKVSFGQVPETEGIRCTLTQSDRKHRNHDLILSSYGNDPEDALLMSLYKVEVMYKGERLPENKGSGRRG